MVGLVSGYVSSPHCFTNQKTRAFLSHWIPIYIYILYVCMYVYNYIYYMYVYIYIWFYNPYTAACYHHFCFSLVFRVSSQGPPPTKLP